jgi:hypothetical protein
VFTVEVAGLAGLLVAKLHKINDRLKPGIRPDRQVDKDASDVVRIILDCRIDDVAATIRGIRNHERAGRPTMEAIDLLLPLFGRPNSPGVEMAARALDTDMPAARVRAVCVAFATDLTRAVLRV